jgi:hypothetical protein
MSGERKMKNIKTKAQRIFEKLNNTNVGLDKDYQIAERQRQAYYYWLKEFGNYMYQLALQGKLFTIQKKDGNEYMRPVNKDKE